MSENEITVPWEEGQFVKVNGANLVYVATRGVIHAICFPGKGRVRVQEVVLSGATTVAPRQVRNASPEEMERAMKGRFQWAPGWS